jgi:hypothetical protein
MIVKSCYVLNEVLRHNCTDSWIDISKNLERLMLSNLMSAYTTVVDNKQVRTHKRFETSLPSALRV